jgi:putative endonuclease
MEQDSRSPGQTDLWVYMLECENGAYYTGYTTDLVKRFRQHLEGKDAARFTRSFKPTRIAQCWRLECSTGVALRVEHVIKKLTRRRKQELVDNPTTLSSLLESKLDCTVAVRHEDPAQTEHSARAI